MAAMDDSLRSVARPDDRSRSRPRAVGVALAIALVGLAVGVALVLVVAVGLRAVGVGLTPTMFIVVSLVLVQGVAFGGVALGYLRFRGLDGRYLGLDAPFRDVGRDALVVVVGYVLALGAAFTGAVVVSLSGVEAGTNSAAELGAQNPEVLLLLIPGSLLFIGPGEELLFRGVVQGRIREAFPPVAGVVLAAALFAAVHYAALTGGASARLVSISILFLPSLVFGAAYEYTGNVAVPALIHGAYNATLFTLLYVAVRFGDALPAPEPGGAPGESTAAAAGAVVSGLPVAVPDLVAVLSLVA
jgi:hypothetical protein